jgi:hypothetical protein
MGFSNPNITSARIHIRPPRFPSANVDVPPGRQLIREGHDTLLISHI